MKRICKDAFRVGGAVQETCSSEMFGGQGADFPMTAAKLEPGSVRAVCFAYKWQLDRWMGEMLRVSMGSSISENENG